MRTIADRATGQVTVAKTNRSGCYTMIDGRSLLSRFLGGCLPVLIVVGFFPVHVAAEDFDADYDAKPWAEVAVKLPPFPRDEDQIPFMVGANTHIKYSIDKRSLSVGGDGVIRFVLTVVSDQGARNISYEGMRCSTAERRFYAFGRPDGTWSKARGNQWVKIRGTSNNHHVGLYFNYFCPLGAASNASPEDLLRLLRQGGQTR
ncbi:MAG: CNP1-like family protein [Propionivibrio sp.]